MCVSGNTTRSALFVAASQMRPMVLATVALVSRKTGATLQAVSVSFFPFHTLLVPSRGQHSPATFTLGSHDFAIVSCIFRSITGNRRKCRVTLFWSLCCQEQFTYVQLVSFACLEYAVVSVVQKRGGALQHIHHAAYQRYNVPWTANHTTYIVAIASWYTL